MGFKLELAELKPGSLRIVTFWLFEISTKTQNKKHADSLGVFQLQRSEVSSCVTDLTDPQKHHSNLLQADF